MPEGNSEVGQEGTTPTPKQDAVPTAVTQEDLNNFRSAYDKQLADLGKRLKASDEALVASKAEADLLRVGVSGDAAQAVDRERRLREREAQAEVREKDLAKRQHDGDAAELVAEAKAKWGLDIKPEDLTKLANRGEMAIFILRQVSGKPGVGKQAIPLTGGGQVPTLRYQAGNLAQGLEDFLRKEGRL